MSEFKRLGAFTPEVAWVAEYDPSDRSRPRRPARLFYADNGHYNITGEARELSADDPRVRELEREALERRVAFRYARIALLRAEVRCLKSRRLEADRQTPADSELVLV